MTSKDSEVTPVASSQGSTNSTTLSTDTSADFTKSPPQSPAISSLSALAPSNKRHSSTDGSVSSAKSSSVHHEVFNEGISRRSLTRGHSDVCHLPAIHENTPETFGEGLETANTLPRNDSFALEVPADGGVNAAAEHAKSSSIAKASPLATAVGCESISEKEEKKKPKGKAARQTQIADKPVEAPENAAGKISKFPKAVRKTIQGTFVKPRLYVFEVKSEETAASTPGKAASKATTAPAKTTKKAVPKSNVKESPAATSSANVAAETEAKKPLVDKQVKPKGGLRSERINALLEKYLSAVGASNPIANTQPSNTTNAIKEKKPKLKARSIPTDGPTKPKRIMQVKTEQDIAIKQLQEAPVAFKAKPIPTAVVEPRLDKILQAGKARPGSGKQRFDQLTREKVKEEQHNNLFNTAHVFGQAKSVPEAVTEPRFALMVADEVLKDYTTTAAEKAFASTASTGNIVVTAGVEDDVDEF